MSSWRWLTDPPTPDTPGLGVRVLAKAALLFAAVNVLFALLDPLPALGRVSLYNTLLPGRPRLPFSDRPAQSYNLSLMSLEAMLAAHAVARPAAPDEYRVLLLGDSSVWGVLLRPDETLAARLNAAGLTAPDGRRLRFYNLGHPAMALAKDLLLLDAARPTRPDAVWWLVTLQSFPREAQLEPPLVQHNAAALRRLIAAYGLDLDPVDPRLTPPDFFERTLVGRRRDLADWLRLQLYGFTWAATGIDQYYPETYTPRTEDFEADVRWREYPAPALLSGRELAFDVLAAGMVQAGAPVVVVNEPIFRSSGRNSDLRYNAWYPRWAYDAYRAALAAEAAARGWRLLDLWDAIPPDAFTDSPVHLTPAGSQRLADRLAAFVRAQLSPG